MNITSGEEFRFQTQATADGAWNVLNIEWVFRMVKQNTGEWNL